MTEHEKAKRWRERHNLSHDQLAELTGYSRESIYWFERGCAPPRPAKGERAPKGGKHPTAAIKPWVWLRYKRACQGVDAELSYDEPQWDWPAEGG